MVLLRTALIINETAWNKEKECKIRVENKSVNSTKSVESKNKPPRKFGFRGGLLPHSVLYYEHFLKFRSVQILAKTRPKGSATTISAALVSHVDASPILLRPNWYIPLYI